MQRRGDRGYDRGRRRSFDACVRAGARVRVRARKQQAKKRVETLNKKSTLRARVEATAGGGSGV